MDAYSAVMPTTQYVSYASFTLSVLALLSAL
jgi:hypothetical protein